MPSARRRTWWVDRVRHPMLPLVVAVDEGDALVYVGLGGELRGLVEHAVRHGARLVVDRRPASHAARQLREYLDGTRRRFELQVQLLGTAFQRGAWSALQAIDYGSTATYGEQAAAMGRPTSARAIGQANARNPIPIVVPCHRVVGASGHLTGFGGGIEVKRWLLQLERHPHAPPTWRPRRDAPKQPQLELFA